MFMHAGFAMLETGCCRAKNASNVLMKNLVNVSLGVLLVGSQDFKLLGFL